MKNNRIFSAAALGSLLVAGLAACTADESYLAGTDALPLCGDGETAVTMTVPGFVREDAACSDAPAAGRHTRTTVSINPDPVAGGAFFRWSSGDQVGVFPKEGEQTGFTIADGVGSNTAKFDGGSWSLRPQSDYAAYYPYHRSVEFSRQAVPVTYPTAVAQTGNASPAHVCTYDYMAARATTPQSGSVDFRFAHLGTLVELSLTLPEAGEVKQIVLSADQPWYATAGTFDLMAATPAIAPTAFSKTLTIHLSGVTAASAGDVVKAYFMMAPVTLGANQVKVTVNGFESFLPAKTFRAGKVYPLTVSFKNAVPEGCVDLGLSVYWADHNVGATTPQGFGDYVSWGEIAGKSSYWQKDSKTYAKQGDWNSGIVGNALYDAATAQWGASWRLPSQEECDELIAGTDYLWVDQSTQPELWKQYGETCGCLFRGRGAYSGSAVFLPAAGYKEDGYVSGVDSEAIYWTATPIAHNTQDSYSLYFSDADDMMTDPMRRYSGCSIRAVQNKP